MPRVLLLITSLMPCFVLVSSTGFAQSVSAQPVSAQSGSAMSRIRPLGSSSLVDRYRNNPVARQPQSRRGERDLGQSVLTRNETAFRQETSDSSQRGSVRQTVWMQNGFDPPPLGNTGIGMPSGSSAATTSPPPSSPLPATEPFPGAGQPQPRALPSPTASDYAPSSSDQSYVPRPELDVTRYARVDNCNLVTGPSTYMAASAAPCGCAPVYPVTFTTPLANAAPSVVPGSLPAEIAVPAAVVPTVSAPTAAATAPARALISFGQENYAVQVGQGLWGQPVAYVPGQNLRNWLRYFSP